MRSIFLLTVFAVCCAPERMALDASGTGASIHSLNQDHITCDFGLYEGVSTVLCRFDCGTIETSTYGDGAGGILNPGPSTVQTMFSRIDDDIIWHAIRCLDP